MKESESESKVLKIEESESELLCTDYTALLQTINQFATVIKGHWCILTMNT
jgi:hypothetical protein